MSKELEALDNIKRDLEYITRLDYVEPIVRGEVRDELYKIYHRELPELDIIETALKRLEQQNALINVIKEVFEFGVINEKVIEKNDGSLSLLGQIGYNLRREISNKEKMLYRDFILKECFPKELKAFEIIKEKEVNMFIFLHSGDLETYNDMVEENRKLTQEEYDLLKKVLL